MGLTSGFYQKEVFLFDLDGTLYLGKKILPGALDLIQKLRSLKRKIFFLTNNSSLSDYDYFLKLQRMGFSPRQEEIIMSTHSLILFLQQKSFHRIFLLGTPAMKKMLKHEDLQVVSEKPEIIVVGFDKTLTYEKLKVASQYIEKGVPWVATHPDIFCPTEKGREPDCGAFAALLQQVTQKKPVMILGKPHSLMLKVVIQKIACRRHEMILIGDRLTTDILMGLHFGIDTVLVLTGETQFSDLKKSKIKPRWVVPNLRKFL